MKTLLYALVPLAVVACAARADDNLHVEKLVITPAAAPQPHLRYRFYPTERELRSGNAAALYYRAIVLLRQDSTANGNLVKADEWLDLPPEKLPRAEVRKVMDQFGPVLEEVRIGASRKDVAWDIPLAEHGIATLLPEIQDTRTLARLMMLKVRLAVADGDYPAASRWLQTMSRLGDQVGDSNTLVSMLVGVAIQGLVAAEVEHWIAQPGSPNAYWRATSMGTVMSDSRRSFESEEMWIKGSLPYGELLGTAILRPAQLEEITQALSEMIEIGPDVGLDIGLASGETVRARVPSQVVLLPLILRAYPAAKRHLIEAGRDPAEVEAMPPTQVVVLRAVELYREVLDELVIWGGRPYVESQAAWDKLDDRISELADQPDAFLANLMLPAMGAAGRAVVRNQQRFAQLRTIEAIRLYAADNDGRLPEKLSDITQVPVPLDPVLEVPFSYKQSGNTATLVTSELGHIFPDVQYELSIGK